MVFRFKYIIIFQFVICSLSTNYSLAQKQLPNGYVVIANDIGKKSVSSAELIQIFKGKYNLWHNNEQVVIVLPSSRHESADVISRYIYNSSKEAMMKYWLSLVFQGRANPPVFLENDASIISYIESNPGAIGIIKIQNQIPKQIIKVID